MAMKYGFLSKSSGPINKFGQIMYFLPKKNVIQDEGVIKYVQKLTQEMEGGGGSSKC
jgi:hypothetical protein